MLRDLNVDGVEVGACGMSITFRFEDEQVIGNAELSHIADRFLDILKAANRKRECKEYRAAMMAINDCIDQLSKIE